MKNYKVSFFIFNDSLLNFNQFDILDNSLFTIVINESRFSWDANKLVSSANRMNFNNAEEFTMSLIYIINNNGPRTDP